MQLSNGQKASLAEVLVTDQGTQLVDFLFREIENSSSPMYCWRGVM
jgi:hypothetical protein